MSLVRAACCSMTKRLALILFAALAWSMPATGQDFPGKPIHLIVPYPPGGGTDTIARQISPKLSAALKQPVIVENKPGASTNIAIEFVAKAVPDGDTLLLPAPNHAETPPAVVTRLNAEIGKALHRPEVREKIAGMGIESVGGTPEEFSRHLTSEAHIVGGAHPHRQHPERVKCRAA